MTSTTLPELTVALGLWQDRPPGEALVTAEAAESSGFPELWIGEMATFDVFALAAAIGQRTASIPMTLGPLSVSVRDPMMLAMGVASVAELSDREVRLALGTSSPRVVEEWHGRERRRPLKAMEEALGELRRLLAGEAGTGRGDLARSTGYRLRLAAPNSPLTVAGFGPAALALGAAAADRVVVSLPTVEAAAEMATLVRAEAEAAARRAPRIATWTPAAVDGSREALDQVRRMLVGYLGAPGYAEMFARAGFADVVAFARTRPHPRELLGRISDDLVSSVAAIGSADEVSRRLASYGEHVDEVAVLPSSTASDPGGVATLAALAARREAARS